MKRDDKDKQVLFLLIIVWVVFGIIPLFTISTDMNGIKTEKGMNDSTFYIKTNITNSYILKVLQSNEPVMIIYPNGTLWIRNGTEQYNGEQLAKVSIAFNSYIKGYCGGINAQSN